MLNQGFDSVNIYLKIINKEKEKFLKEKYRVSLPRLGLILLTMFFASSSFFK